MIIMGLALICGGCGQTSNEAVNAAVDARIESNRAWLDEWEKKLWAEHDAKMAARKAECSRRGPVTIGMTAEQVIASCFGQPDRINRTELASGTIREQWVKRSSYVYLTNGRVTAIQSTR